jgi:PKD repeat protein
MTSRRSTTRIFLATAVVTATLLLGLSGQVAASHWAGTASLGPTQVYQDELVTFRFTLYNAASGSVDVYWIFSQFCWLPENQGYYFKANDGTAISIPGGGSYTFKLTIRVSQTYSGSCTVDTDVRGKAVGDLFQETATWRHTIVVDIPPPLSVVATANPNSGTAPLSVSFNAQVSGEARGSSVTWVFGDGTTGSGSAASHTYTATGTFTATATVTDGLGRIASDSVMVTVTAPPPPPPGGDTGGGTDGGAGGGASGIGSAGTWILLGIVIAAIAAILAVLSRARKKPQSAVPRQPVEPPQRPPQGQQ